MTNRTKAITAFCKLRRLQEANESGYVKCITCGKLVKWDECDGGHMISRRYRGTETLHDNVWPQCIGCNRFGNITEDEYRDKLLHNIGRKRIDDVYKEKDIEKYYDYEDLTKEFNEEIRKIKKEKGL